MIWTLYHHGLGNFSSPCCYGNALWFVRVELNLRKTLCFSFGRNFLNPSHTDLEGGWGCWWGLDEEPPLRDIKHQNWSDSCFHKDWILHQKQQGEYSHQHFPAWWSSYCNCSLFISLLMWGFWYLIRWDISYVDVWLLSYWSFNLEWWNVLSWKGPIKIMESHSLLLHTEFKARPELCACAAVLLSFSVVVSHCLSAEPW